MLTSELFEKFFVYRQRNENIAPLENFTIEIFAHCLYASGASESLKRFT